MSSELASLIEANTRIDGTFPTPIPGLHLSRYSSRTQPGQGVVQCPTLAIVAQGSKQLLLGDEAFTYAPGFCLVVSLDLPVSGRVTSASKTKPFLGMHMDLDVKQIPSLRTSGKIQRAKKRDRGVFLSRMTPELLDPILRLLRLLGKPEDAAVLAPLLHREILYRLWRGEQGEQLERMAQADGNVSGVVKAVIWLKENFDKPFFDKAYRPGGEHESFWAPPPFQDAHQHDSPSISKAASFAGSSAAHVGRGDGCVCCGVSRWLCQPLPVHPRIQPSLWSPATSGRRADPEATSDSRIVRADKLSLFSGH
jgi:AraC-type transcriptional regulator N-terminus